MPDAQMIGPYRLERVLGTGSFATVWLARDDVLDRNVAIKILADNWSRDDEVRRRFLSEARVLLTVESPRIVRGFHLGEAATGQPYLVMAWADRGTLGDRIDQRRREGRTFDASEVVGIAGEVADALTDVHGSGHLHRDVKPTNVLIRSSSTRRSIAGLAADETIVLADFGLARGLDLSALTLVAGSPGYVAPEQAAGLTQLDRRADLYSLGRIMLELLTGDPGGRATTMAGAASERIDVPKLMDVLHEKGGNAPSPQLVDLITHLVGENPDDRPSSADEVTAELNAISRSLGPQGGAGRPLAPPSAPPLAAAVGLEGGRPLTGTQLSAPAPRARSISLTDKRVLAGAAVALVAIAAIIVALALGGGDGGDTDGSTTTVNTAATVTTLRGVVGTDETPSSTNDIGTTEPATSGPTSDTVVSGEEIGYGQLAGQMVLPEQVFVDGKADGELQPGRQAGSTIMTPDEFAAALVEANTEWTAAGVPQADADGNVEFSIAGPSGETATVTVSQQANTAFESALVTRYSIEYE